jgi:hypothetical protein
LRRGIGQHHGRAVVGQGRFDDGHIAVAQFLRQGSRGPAPVCAVSSSSTINTFIVISRSPYIIGYLMISLDRLLLVTGQALLFIERDSPSLSSSSLRIALLTADRLTGNSMIRMPSGL